MEGIDKIRTPHQIESPIVNYVVIGFALVFEGAVWLIAVQAFRKAKGPLGWLNAVRLSKDPTVFTVLFEDTAALLGLIVALLGIWLSQRLGMSVLDGVASLVIGLILRLQSNLYHKPFDQMLSLVCSNSPRLPSPVIVQFTSFVVPDEYKTKHVDTTEYGFRYIGSQILYNNPSGSDQSGGALAVDAQNVSTAGEQSTSVGLQNLGSASGTSRWWRSANRK